MIKLLYKAKIRYGKISKTIKIIKRGELVTILAIIKKIYSTWWGWVEGRSVRQTIYVQKINIHTVAIVGF